MDTAEHARDGRLGVEIGMTRPLPGRRPAGCAAAPVVERLGRAPLSAILSAARSGSTWLGAIVDTVPELAYRFEPLHRSGIHEPVMAAFEAALDGVGPIDVAPVIDVLQRTTPSIDKPPFFAKRWHSRGNHGAWVLARALPGTTTAHLYRRRFRAPVGTPVVFKEVDYGHRADAMVRRAGMHLTYLVRHPCGAVGSNHRGQIADAMPTGRQRHMRSHLHELGRPDLVDEFDDVLDTMSDLQRTALLWRAEVEAGMAAVDAAPTGMAQLVVYERLCDDPLGAACRVIEGMGHRPSAATAEFLQRVGGGRDRAPLLRRDARERYFSVYRDPDVQRDRWRRELVAADIDAILEVATQSPVYDRLSSLGGWD